VGKGSWVVGLTTPHYGKWDQEIKQNFGRRNGQKKYLLVICFLDFLPYQIVRKKRSGQLGELRETNANYNKPIFDSEKEYT